MKPYGTIIYEYIEVESDRDIIEIPLPTVSDWDDTRYSYWASYKRQKDNVFRFISIHHATNPYGYKVIWEEKAE